MMERCQQGKSYIVYKLYLLGHLLSAWYSQLALQYCSELVLQWESVSVCNSFFMVSPKQELTVLDVHVTANIFC